MFKKTMVLGLICFFSALFLSFAYLITTPIIAQQELKSEKEGISDFLPGIDKIIEEKKGEKTYYCCYKKGEIVGYGLIVFAQGYASEIKLMVVIDKDKTIRGIRVLEQRETPGLGAKISEDWFENQFKEKKAEDLILGEGIEAISGATISSQAVTEAVRKSVEEFEPKAR